MIANIDTLYASVLVSNYAKASADLIDTLHKKLEERFFSRARAKEYLELGGVSFELVNGRYSWSYGLKCNDFTLYLAHRQTSANFPIYVEFRQEYLWQEGYKLAWVKFISFLGKIGFKYEASKVSRGDLACHTDEDLLQEKYLDLLHFDPRCKNFSYIRGQLTRGDYDVEKRQDVEKFGKGKTYTGIRIGMGNPLMARIYNKTEEIQISKKQWFEHIWAEHGLKGKIINVEFEIKREWFHEWGIESVEDLFKDLDTIWYKLTRNYLSFRKLDNDRRSRRTMCEFWQNIRAASFAFDGSVLSKRHQVELNIDNARNGAFGYITSYAAALGFDQLDDTLMKTLLNDIFKMANNRQISIAEKIQQKKQRKVDPVDLERLFPAAAIAYST